MNTFSRPSTNTVSNSSHSKPRKALPKNPTLTKAKPSSLEIHQPTSVGEYSNASTSKQSYRLSTAPPCKIFVTQTNTIPHPSRSSLLLHDGPFPPRRPIQRSLYALEQVTSPSSMVALSPTSPMTKIHSSARTANPITPTRPLRHPQPQCSGTVPVSPIPIQHPLISPLKEFFDHTIRCVYSELSHLQSSCLGVLNKERREKETLRAYFLKMKRERDVAVERARELENHQNRVSSRAEKRRREGVFDGDSMRIQPPPVPDVQSSEQRQFESTSQDTDTYKFSCPERSSTASPSPPPPPISGRRLYFSTSRATSSSPRPSGSTPEHISSSSARAALEATSDPRNTNDPSSEPGMDSNRLKLLSPFHSSDEDELLYPPIKRRRVSASSESSDHSNVTLVQDSLPGPSSKVDPETTSRPPSRHFLSDTGYDSEWGECDMDLEGDSDDESGLELASPDLGSCEKEAEVVAVVKEERCDDEDAVALLDDPGPPLTGDSDHTAVADRPEPQWSKEDFPPLNIHDLAQMYAQYDGRVYCRLCCSRKPDAQWHCDSPLPDMDARYLDLDVLMEHCTSQHPVAYSDVAGLTLHQVFKLKRMLEANKAARMSVATA